VVCNGASSNNIRIYVDGVSKYQGLGALNVTGQNLRLGRISDPSNGEYFAGTMDEVRIWNYARTATQINNQKDQELQGNESGLIAYYDFNQGIAGGNNSTETTLNDGANSNDGTLKNFSLSGSTSNWVGDAPSITPAKSPITCTITDPSISCFGEDNGKATVEVSGGNGSAFTYSWSSGSSTSSSTTQNITGGTVTQGAQSTTCSVTITETSGPIAAFFRPSVKGNKNISLQGGADGSIQTLVNGGTAPYTYSWRGPSSAVGPNPSGLKAGSYFLEVTDDQGCSSAESLLYLSEP